MATRAATRKESCQFLLLLFSTTKTKDIILNYQKIYDDIIFRAKNRSKPDCYCEKHHIIPRSMGGSDSKENIAVLTAREHYIAHWLLYKIHRSVSMSYALFAMTRPVGNGRSRYTSHTYRHVREIMSAEMSKKFSGKNHPNYGLKGRDHPSFGQKRSNETKKLLSDKAKARYAKGNFSVSRRIINIETGEIFKTVTSAKRKFKGNISYALKSGGTANGYHFAYLDGDGKPILIKSKLKGYSSHKSRIVLVDGIELDSVKDAANHIGCTGSSVSWAIKNNKQCKGFKVEFKK